MIRVELTGGNLKTIRKKLQSKFDELAKDATDEISKVYGRNFVNQKMFEDGFGFTSEAYRPGSSRMKDVGSKNLFKKVADIYEEAWLERYQELQDAYRMSGVSDPAHVSKKATDPDYRAPWWGGKRANYSPAGYGIWSGSLMTDIASAFSVGGLSGQMHGFNWLITGGYHLLEHGSGWPSAYFQGRKDDKGQQVGSLQEYFAEVLPALHGGQLIRFDNEVYNRARSAMLDILSTHFVDPVVDAFNRFEMRV